MSRSAQSRWYRHGWNRPLSWELVLRITPRLPRFILVPLHHLTTLVSLICMPGERAAACRNLRRVTGATGLALYGALYRLFLNFSRFIVAYGETGTTQENDLAEAVKAGKVTKPVIVFLGGMFTKAGVAQSHAGAMILTKPSVSALMRSCVGRNAVSIASAR